MEKFIHAPVPIPRKIALSWGGISANLLILTPQRGIYDDSSAIHRWVIEKRFNKVPSGRLSLIPKHTVHHNRFHDALEIQCILPEMSFAYDVQETSTLYSV